MPVSENSQTNWLYADGLGYCTQWLVSAVLLEEQRVKL